MKPLSKLPLAALFIASVRSQGADCTSVALSAIPSCAQPCFLEGAPTIGCGGLDFACQCRQQAALFAAVESCVASSCPSSQYQDVIDGAAAVCECAAGAAGGTQGSQVVSGSYAPSASFPPVSTTPPPVTTTSSPVPSNGGGGGGAVPTQSAPSESATPPVTAAAAGQPGCGWLFAAPAFAAALVLTVL